MLRAVASCYAQRNVALEVLVYDDASEDGTAQAVCSSWPQARVFRVCRKAGQAENRNRGFRDARADIIVSLDDDAYFTSPDTIAQVIEWFHANAGTGAMAIPYMEPLNRRSLSSRAAAFTEQPGAELRSYVGCAYAIRRQVAVALGGYREMMIGWHEEREFCTRLRAAGWDILYADTDPVVHMVSPRRDRDRITFYGGRNQILAEYFNTPFPDVVWRIVAGSIGFIRYRFSLRALPNRVRAIAAGCRDAVTHRALRKPVGREFYRNHRRLPAHGPIDWQGPVPAPCHDCNPAP